MRPPSFTTTDPATAVFDNPHQSQDGSIGMDQVGFGQHFDEAFAGDGEMPEMRHPWRFVGFAVVIAVVIVVGSVLLFT